MDRNRRAFLATVGTVATGGCLGVSGKSVSSTTTSSTTTTAPDDQTTTTDDPLTTTDDSDGDSSKSQESRRTTIGFAGDAMVGRNLNDIYGREGVDPASIWGDFQPRLQSLAGVCCNLECCLSTRGERYPGQAYYFRGDPGWAVPALKAGNVQFTALANNHAMDFRTIALTDTFEILNGADIANAGTGETLTGAWEPATFALGGLDIAVVSFSDEYQYYGATEDRPGIAWAKTNPTNSHTQRVVGNAIKRAKSTNPDLLVASVHWGENWIERPNDRLVAFGHWLVDQGVDLVHGHSAHAIQAIEQYGDGIILHDTGDLVDDFGVVEDVRNDLSYLFEVTFDGKEPDQIRLVPFHIDNGVSRAGEEEAAWLRKTMRDRSEPFETTYERAGDGLVVKL